MKPSTARAFACYRSGATRSHRLIFPAVLAAFAAVSLLPGRSGRADDQPAPRKTPWTLEEARTQLRLYPRDAYLQYVVLMLERQRSGNDGSGDEAMTPFAQRGPGRGRGVDLFSLFSGSSAVQESLQLDTMRGEPTPGRAPRRPRMPPARPFAKGGPPRVLQAEPEPTPPPKSVEIVSLAGPTIQSHPWEKMLNGQKPLISPLAHNVPADFYFIQFHSVDKLLDAIEASDLWGQHLFSQAWQEARTPLFARRIRQQLALEVNPALRPFYDSVVSEIAVTGSDLYVREGSDVTLLFQFKQPQLFHTRMDSFLSKAVKSHPDARRSEGEYQGVNYAEVSTPDRSIHVFSAYPEPDLHVRSNSRSALERVIDAIHRKDSAGRPVTPLGDTPEFAYIRTLMTEGAPEEDGFIYLSDPFIRRLVGPQVKLTERRRMICYNHLRMIGHAVLFHLTQQGKKAGSLAELEQSHSTPGEFGKGRLACPDGGTYTLASDSVTAVCSHHGHAHALVPCCEIPLADVTGEEAEQYQAFLENYNQYWRTFFDPIAVRIQVRPDRYRIETIVLPLMDNSLYTTLARATGGPVQQLDALPVPKRNIFSVSVRFNKLAVARLLGAESLLESPDERTTPIDPMSAARDTPQVVGSLRTLGFAWHNYHDTNGAFPTSEPRDNMPANSPRSGLSWRVHLLPYLGQEKLASQFHMQEPWDSPHNKALISKMPFVYRPADPKLVAQGKTRIVAPIGDKLISTKKAQHIGIRDITDGTSNTIMLVEVDDQHAVIWTKPDDLEVDLARPQAGLAIRPPGGFLVEMADASIHFVKTTINRNDLAALFTRAGGEVVSLTSNEFPLQPPQPRGGLLYGINADSLRPLRIAEFVSKGIGDEIGLHVYDSDPLFAFSLPSAIGQSLGNFGGRGSGFLGGNEMLLIGVVVAMLQSPIYISVPVRDAKVVDDFLGRLDQQLAAVARASESNAGGFFSFGQDFYRLQQANIPIHAYAFQLGPIKWRVFWARIGNGLYIASKPFILEDIAALNSNAPERPDTNGERAGHAMVRMRAANWNRVISSYKLGWAENNRAACLHNLGPLSSLARAVVPAAARKPGADLPAEIGDLGGTIYDTHFYCPDGGHYVFAPDGSVACSVHGFALAPRQPDAPSAASDPGRLLASFSDVTLLLTFREEGLHAVVTIERKQAN